MQLSVGAICTNMAGGTLLILVFTVWLFSHVQSAVLKSVPDPLTNLPNIEQKKKIGLTSYLEAQASKSQQRKAPQVVSGQTAHMSSTNSVKCNDRLVSVYSDLTNWCRRLNVHCHRHFVTRPTNKHPVVSSRQKKRKPSDKNFQPSTLTFKCSEAGLHIQIGLHVLPHVTTCRLCKYKTDGDSLPAIKNPTQTQPDDISDRAQTETQKVEKQTETYVFLTFSCPGEISSFLSGLSKCFETGDCKMEKANIENEAKDKINVSSSQANNSSDDIVDKERTNEQETELAVDNSKKTRQIKFR